MLRNLMQARLRSTQSTTECGTSVDKERVMVVFERTKSPLSELDIMRVENRLGIRLPHDLREHYLRHNGGIPHPQFFPKDGDAYEVRNFLPMNIEDPIGLTFEDAYVSMVDQTPEDPQGYIPFAIDPAGDMFLYSVRPESFGNIMFISHEDYQDPDRYIVFFAPTLEQFINSLTELPEGL